MASLTEVDAIRKELTIEQIQALPGMIGRIASVQCQYHGEYKYREVHEDGTEIKTHIVLVNRYKAEV